MGKLVKYYKSHIWCSFVCIFIAVFLIYFYILQNYMQTQYYSYLEEKTIEAETAIMDSVGLNIEHNLDSIIKITAEVVSDSKIKSYTEKAAKGVLTVSEEIEYKSLLDQYLNSSPYILNIAVFQETEILKYTNRSDKNISIWNQEDEEVLKDSYNTLKEKTLQREVPKTKFLSMPLKYISELDKKAAHIAVPLIYNTNHIQNIYMLILSFNTELFGEEITKIYQSNEGVAEGYVTNQEDMILYNQDFALRGEQLEIPKESIKLSKEIEGTDWNIYILLDTGQLFHNIGMLYQKGYVNFLLGFVLVIFIIGAAILVILIRPLRMILASINLAKQGVEQKIPIKNNNEIYQVAIAFNHLLDSLKESRAKEAKAHREKMIALQKKQEFEWKTLESQINAHFICNTIGCISYEAIDAGSKKVAVLLKKLSNILRYTFDKSNEKVFLYQEILWIEQYLSLQKLRYEKTFDYKINVAPQYQEYVVIKLLLQPFVENSFIHGFKDKEDKKYLYIYSQEGEQEGEFYIYIQDNGSGMDKETANRLEEALKNPYEPVGKIGIGILNVEQRLRTLFGCERVISFWSREREGTTFKLHILKKEERRDTIDENYYSGR